MSWTQWLTPIIPSTMEERAMCPRKICKGARPGKCLLLLPQASCWRCPRARLHFCQLLLLSNLIQRKQMTESGHSFPSCSALMFSSLRILKGQLDVQRCLSAERTVLSCSRPLLMLLSNHKERNSWASTLLTTLPSGGQWKSLDFSHCHQQSSIKEYILRGVEQSKFFEHSVVYKLNQFNQRS